MSGESDTSRSADLTEQALSTSWSLAAGAQSEIAQLVEQLERLVQLADAVGEATLDVRDTELPLSDQARALLHVGWVSSRKLTRNLNAARYSLTDRPDPAG